MYISFKILVERLKRGFPLNPPVSAATGLLLTGSGLETVVFDIIWKKKFFRGRRVYITYHCRGKFHFEEVQRRIEATTEHRVRKSLLIPINTFI